MEGGASWIYSNEYSNKASPKRKAPVGSANVDFPKARFLSDTVCPHCIDFIDNQPHGEKEADHTASTE